MTNAGRGKNMGTGQGSGRGGGKGQGRGQGRGQGWGDGQDQGSGQASRGGQGRNRGGAFGPGGYCVCAKCGKKIPHGRGVKCTDLKCPDCGRTMIREELLDKKRK